MKFAFLPYHDKIMEEWELAIDKVHSQKEFLNFWHYKIQHLNRKYKAKFPRGYIKRMNQAINNQ
jgi:hypothetical protein